MAWHPALGGSSRSTSRRTGEGRMPRSGRWLTLRTSARVAVAAAAAAAAKAPAVPAAAPVTNEPHGARPAAGAHANLQALPREKKEHVIRPGPRAGAGVGAGPVAGAGADVESRMVTARVWRETGRKCRRVEACGLS